MQFANFSICVLGDSIPSRLLLMVGVRGMYKRCSRNSYTVVCGFFLCVCVLGLVSLEIMR